ncbi:MAG: superoxide dismutase [Planctomycetia bacterium]|nr:superoxide dismutase [Planctomycetia bacterium]
MAYTLPELPYPFSALYPHIDAKTMEIHHGKHHATYVTNLNKALEGSNLGDQPIETLVAKIDTVPENIRTAVRNNGGGHANHSMFWTIMGRGCGGDPTGDLGAAINNAFGGYAGFKEKFTAAALGRFGSGWAWLSLDANKKLLIESTPNQDNPLMHSNKPILGLDVWEHAYYLLYQNRRADYVGAWYNLINWKAVADRYAQALRA